jgi:hypothetical protein
MLKISPRWRIIKGGHMSPVNKLENALDETLNKKAPYQLPASTKKSIANILWVVALVFGAIQLWLAWIFWRDAHRVNELVDWANSLTTAFGGKASVDHIGVFFYLSVVALAVDGVLLLMAVAGLKGLKKAGWNLMFYSLLLNVAYGILRMFSEYGNEASYLIGSIISSVIGAYLLFQVRELFTGKTSAPAATPPAPTVTPKA